mmetsp:Transcript_81911/g.196394  ORF Transcript_81911/g.196394 Transcript_81911/m.196394 type:complete len:311 (+) Transcript_81911:1159-2091(+)
MHDASFLHHLIANFLDLFQLLWLHWLIVGEVESQLVLCNQRTFLIDLLAQDLTKRKIQDVCCCVVLCHQRSSSVIDLHAYFIADFQVALALDLPDMEDIASVFLRVVYAELNTATGDRSLVESLSTLLRIQRGPVQHEANYIGAAVAGLHEILSIVNCLDLGLVLAAIALGVPIVLEYIIGGLQAHAFDELVCFIGLQLHVLRRSGSFSLPGLVPELLHLLFKAGHVHFDLQLFAHQLRQIHWEAICREEQESIFACNGALLGKGLELLDSSVQRSSELRFLFPDNRPHIFWILSQGRERIAQCFEDGVN